MKKASTTTMRPTPPVADVREQIGELILYTTADDRTVIQLRQDQGTFWLSQKVMSDLYQVRVPTINVHLRRIFKDKELQEDAVIRDYLITASDGKNYKTKLYSLEVVLAVGYRVRSHRGVQFRQWATEHLREYLEKGFMLDDARLKEGYPEGAEYFEELLSRIRDIRSTEKVFYRKLRDIFSLSTDYTSQSREALKLFFQKVQNALHYAAAEHTASEIIKSRAKADLPNMGLTNWTGQRIRKADVSIAKSYLSTEELDTLNRIVSMFLDQAEFRARRRQVIYMADWEQWLRKFLNDQELPVLPHAGKVGAQAAKAHAEHEYDLFHARRLALEAEEANNDASLHSLEEALAQKGKQGTKA